VSQRLETAREALFRAGFGDFVTERKRLAAELKAAGAKDEAALLAKLPRPPVSAWAVNQLWWNERDAFEALLAAAAGVKRGERDAGKQHREALASLRQRAGALLQEAGNAASEGTLRRIATTLSAVAASGSFEPDAPGMLSADRDPPGFETFVASAAPVVREAAPSKTEREEAPSKAAREAAAAQRRAEEEERKRRQAERERLSEALREAQHLKGTQQREVARLQRELETAEQGLKDTQTLLADLETKLSSL
jgi:hypothetical protein